MKIVRSWREQKVMLKRRFPVITEEDLFFEKGKEEKMFLRLSKKLRLSLPEINLLLKDLERF